MNCSRCDLPLSRGSVHVSAEGCIDALKEKLEKAATCRACDQPVQVVIHPGCVPAEMVNRGAKLGVGVVEKRLTEWLAKKLAGEPERPRARDQDDDVDPMDRDQRRSSRGHWEP